MIFYESHIEWQERCRWMLNRINTKLSSITVIQKFTDEKHTWVAELTYAGKIKFGALVTSVRNFSASVSEREGVFFSS